MAAASPDSAREKHFMLWRLSLPNPSSVETSSSSARRKIAFSRRLHFPVKSRRGKSFVCDPHFAKDVFGCLGGYIKHVAVWVSITREARSRFRAKNRLSYLATEKGTALVVRFCDRSITARPAYAHINPLNAKCLGFDNFVQVVSYCFIKRS